MLYQEFYDNLKSNSRPKLMDLNWAFYNGRVTVRGFKLPMILDMRMKDEIVIIDIFRYRGHVGQAETHKFDNVDEVLKTLPSYIKNAWYQANPTINESVGDTIYNTLLNALHPATLKSDIKHLPNEQLSFLK